MASPPQEKKKVQSQVVVEQENLFGSRPSTSSRRLSNMSLNGGFSTATALNRRLSLGIQQLGSNSINSPTQGLSFIKEGKKAKGQKMSVRQSLVSHLREETASVVPTFSGPLSPWILTQITGSSRTWEVGSFSYGAIVQILYNNNMINVSFYICIWEKLHNYVLPS